MTFMVESLRASDTRARILEAAFQAVATHGLSRFTMDDVARLAGVSRQSVYRYFDSKDDLVLALVEREEEVLIQAVRAAHAANPDLEEAMEASMLLCLRAVREHPLLGRLLASEPEVLLPYLTTRGGGLIHRGQQAMEELSAGRTDVRHELVHRAADLAVRAVISYALTPSDEDPEAIARETARVICRAIRNQPKEDHR